MHPAYEALLEKRLVSMETTTSQRLWTAAVRQAASSRTGVLSEPLTELRAWQAGKREGPGVLGGLKSFSVSLTFLPLPLYCKQKEEEIAVIKSISLCISAFLLTHYLVGSPHTHVCMCMRMHSHKHTHTLFQLDKWQLRGGAFAGALRDSVSFMRKQG